MNIGLTFREVHTELERAMSEPRQGEPDRSFECLVSKPNL
jgi:hypothetical protein